MRVKKLYQQLKLIVKNVEIMRQYGGCYKLVVQMSLLRNFTDVQNVAPVGPPPVDLGEPVAEDEGPTGNPEVDNEQFVTFDAEAVNEGGTSISGNILANDSFGPDGKHPDEPVPTIFYNGGLGAATGSQVGNDAVFVAEDGTWTMVISFIDGSYVFTQHEAYSHDIDADFDDGLFTYTLQDADGDTASGTLTVRIIDDEPSGIFINCPGFECCRIITISIEEIQLSTIEGQIISS